MFSLMGVRYARHQWLRCSSKCHLCDNGSISSIVVQSSVSWIAEHIEIKHLVQHAENKSTLGRAILLDRPGSVYKRDVECRFVESWFEMFKWPWRSRSMTPYSTPVKGIPDAHLVQIWWFQLKSISSYCGDKPNFLDFWDKMPKMTLKVNVNDPYFRYLTRISQDPCLVQIWRF